MAEAPEWLIVGKVVAAFGTKGEIRIVPETDFDQRFVRGARLNVEHDERAFTVEHSRQHKGQFVVKLNGIDDREAAEALRGRRLQVPGSDLVALPENEYYLFQIIGLNVYTDDRRELGSISQVLHTGANDVYVVPREKGELLLPAIAEVIKEIDLTAGRMIVHLLPGLLPEESAPGDS